MILIMMKFIWSLALILLLPLLSMAQRNEQAYGNVKAENGEPLIGATVVNTRTEAGSITDQEGAFSLEVQSGDTLRFSFLGYAGYDLLWRPELSLPLSVELSSTSTLLRASTAHLWRCSVSLANFSAASALALAMSSS